MALNLDKKKKIVSEHKNIANSAISVITANISNVKVNEINKLRKKSRNAHVKISIIRNTLLKKSLQNTNFSKLNTILKGPTLIAFSMKHPGTASRLFKEFQKKNKNFIITAAIFEKKILSYQEIDQLAVLPTHKEIITKFIFILKESSLGKLLRILKLIHLKKTKK